MCFVGRVALAFAGIAAATLGVAEAHPYVTLDFSAPDGCPQGAAIADAVGVLVSRVPEQPLEVSAVATQGDRGFFVELTTPTGVRRLEGETCRAVAEALVVILALTIDPSARTEDAEKTLGSGDAVLSDPIEAKPESASVPVNPEPASSSLVLPARPAERGTPGVPRKASARPSFRFGGSALALLEVGMLPAPAGGALLLARLARRPFDLELGGGFLFPRAGSLPENEDLGGDFRWAGGQLSGAVLFADPFRAYLGVELGELSGEGFGVDNQYEGATLWLAGLAGVAARVPFGGDFGLDVRLGLAAPVDRPTFGLARLGPIYRPSPVSGRALVGLAFR
jgi:hypothetical protein